MREQPDGPPRDRSSRSTLPGLFDQHLALVLSALLACFTAVRILTVSGFQSDTARAVVSASDTTTVIIGTLTPVFAVLPAIVLAVLLTRLVTAPEIDATKIGIGLAVLVCAFVTPWPMLLGAIAIPIVSLLIVLIGYSARDLVRHLLGKPAVPSDEAPISSRWTYFGGVAAIILVFTTTGDPWFPAETFEVRGRAAFAGYVLDESEDDLVILRESPRRVDRLPASALLSRSFCDASPRPIAVFRGRVPLFHLLPVNTPRPASYPACP